MEKKPTIVITMGDPAGIGPEIIVKAAESGELFSHCAPVVIGDAGVMKKLAGEMRLSLSLNSMATLAEAASKKGALDVLDLKNVPAATHKWGAPDASSAGTNPRPRTAFTPTKSNAFAEI